MNAPPGCQEHLSLGRFARHLSLALPGLPVVSVANHRLSSIHGEAQARDGPALMVRQSNASSCTIPLERVWSVQPSNRRKWAEYPQRMLRSAFEIGGWSGE